MYCRNMLKKISEENSDYCAKEQKRPSQEDVYCFMLGCGSFVRGRKRKKGDSIPFILSRTLHVEVTR